MTEQDLLTDICNKELLNGCYDSKIHGVSIYSVLRVKIRTILYRNAGFYAMEGQMGYNRKNALYSIIKSIMPICKVFLLHKKYSTVFCAFPRLDKVGGIYLDKFTDPLIDMSGMKEDYIIFEHGRGGTHLRPRIHNNRVVYTDLFYAFSCIYVYLFKKRILKRYNGEFSDFKKSVLNAFGSILDEFPVEEYFLVRLTYSKILQFCLKRISAKKVIGPNRNFLLPLFLAARRLGIKTYEYQHGIVYGKDFLYSGYQDPMVVPDIFFTYGNSSSKEDFGITESRIVNIGWALQSYITNVGVKKYNCRDVLVVSDPGITDAIVHTVLRLSEVLPDSNFYIRPHPHEVVSDYHLNLISKSANIFIQDRNVNITEVLYGFNYVLGENTTCLYEALAICKRVGKLFFKGLNPMYREPQDRNFFWEIYNETDFLKFINDKEEKPKMSYYSPFDADIFLESIK